MSKHTFAFFYKNLTNEIKKLQPGDAFAISNNEVSARIKKVVRLKADETVILFDEHTNVQLKVTPQGSVIEQRQSNKSLQPSLTFHLPLLKKEALEQAVYSAAAMGVQEIVLIKTEKNSRRSQEITKHELSRLEKIIIAACEQSKNFSVPTLTHLKSLEDLSAPPTNSILICFDTDGTHVLELAKELSKTSNNLVVTIGPEGGFSEQEKEFLKNLGFKTYRLTEAILRAREAATVGLGIVRSFTFSQQMFVI